MRTLATVCAALGILGLTSPAHAGGQPGTFGVGAELMFGQFDLGGVSVSYDGGIFDAGGFIGFSNDSDFVDDGDEGSAFGIGGRFFYHVHATPSSDFGVGGRIGLLLASPPGDGDSSTLVILQPGAQVRTFLAPNVAVTGFLGITLGVGDADGIRVGGDVVGGFSFLYFFL